ncbi:MAG TPA: Na/Pi symporter, partial [Opitutus sp.]|nr:Na/Pi symporter [Opitutus sp.]
MRFLRKGLDRLFGGALFRWLSRLSRSRWRAFGGGVVIGTVAPSSTGLAILGAQLLGREAGGLAAPTVLAVLLGASVGLTVAVQLVSFHIGNLASVLMVLGVIGYQFCSREVLRGIGQCLLALGFVFLAMTLIGENARLLTGDGEVREVLLRLQGHRW